MKYFLFLIIVVFHIANISAQHNWTRTNPGGGGAISMVGATKSGIIVAASDLSGIYISSNNGVSWSVSGTEQGLTQKNISALGFHPVDGNTFIIGTGIGAFKTTDGGQSIYPVQLETDPNLGLGYVESIGMALSDANIGYMAHHEWWEPQLSLLSTIDAGETWDLINTTGLPNNARIVKLMVDANSSNLVYALLGKARHGCSDPFLYKSNNSGQTWTRIATNVGNILDFDLHPTDPTIIFLSTFDMHPNGCNVEMWEYIQGGGQTLKSTDSGSSFSPILFFLGGIISIGNNPDDISVVDVVANGGTWKSTDGGINWINSGSQNNWYKGWASSNWAFTTSFNGYNKTLIKDRFDPEKMYGSFGQWAWSSIDGGDHVNNISTIEISPDHYLSTGLENVNANWIDVNASDTNSIYIGAYDLGFWYSKNHGDSWKKSLPDNTIYPDYTWWAEGGSNCNFVISDPVNADIVWASFSAEQPNTESAIFKSTNSGENWTISNTGLNSLGLNTHGISLDILSDVNSRTMYVTQEGDVWKSIDGGGSWTEIYVDGGLKFTEIDKFNNQLIYAGGESGFFRSIDGGSTWTEVGLTEMRFSTTVQNAVMRPDIITEYDELWGNPPIVAWNGVFEIKADPNIANRVYVIGHGDGKGLYRSDDAGLTWTKLYTNDRMRGIAISPANSDIIYASSSTDYHSGQFSSASIGILVSYDAGSSWSFANDDMACTNGGRLVIETGTTPNIWAWVPGTGLQFAPIENFVLPVSILSPFSGVLKDGRVILRWKTSFENQNSGYKIYRSNDGIKWGHFIDVQPELDKNYTVFDKNPFEGISYYNLVQVDYDGFITDLGTVSIKNSSSINPIVYPNPSNGIYTIKLPSDIKSDLIEIQLYNYLGQLIHTKRGSTELDIRSYSNGIYKLAIIIEGEVYWKRIIKE